MEKTVETKGAGGLPLALSCAIIDLLFELEEFDGEASGNRRRASKLLFSDVDAATVFDCVLVSRKPIVGELGLAALCIDLLTEVNDLETESIITATIVRHYEHSRIFLGKLTGYGETLGWATMPIELRNGFIFALLRAAITLDGLGISTTEISYDTEMLKVLTRLIWQNRDSAADDGIGASELIKKYAVEGNEARGKAIGAFLDSLGNQYTKENGFPCVCAEVIANDFLHKGPGTFSMGERLKSVGGALKRGTEIVSL